MHDTIDQRRSRSSGTVCRMLTAEFDLSDETHGSLLRIDIVTLHVGVEESDLATGGVSLPSSHPQVTGHTFRRGRIEHKQRRLCRGCYADCEVSMALAKQCNELTHDLRSSIRSPPCSKAILPESSTRTTTSKRAILTRSLASSTGSFQAEASCCRAPD